MPTKKIQLRGISRTPSDRMSADGGLAESIGFETDMQELAVNVPPEDVTVALGLTTEVAGVEVVYIHKTNDYTNHIARDDSSVGLLDETLDTNDSYYHPFYRLQEGEHLKQIKSIGNTLMLLTADDSNESARIFYVLYKDGVYLSLGDHIPEPQIKLRCKTLDTAAGYYYQAFKTRIAHVEEGDDLRELIMNCSYRQIAAARTDVDHGGRGSQGYKTLEAYTTVEQELRGNINAVVRHNLMNGALSMPVFVRYAVKLYDGTYINHSAPVLIDPDDFTVDNPLPELTFQYTIGSRDSCLTTSPDFIKPYKLLMRVDNADDFTNWQDIVAGVELFVSPQIERFGLEIHDVAGYNQMPSSDDVYESTINLTPLTSDVIRDRILKESQYYVFKRYDIKDYITLDGRLFTVEPFNDSYDHPQWNDSAGIEDYLEAFDPLTLPTRERLDDDSHTHDRRIPSSLFVYNERLMLSGVKVKHYHGYPDMPSTAPSGLPGNIVCKYRVRYYVRTEKGNTVIVEKEYNKKLDDVTPTDATPRMDYRLGGWLFYPDVLCYKARVMLEKGGTFALNWWKDFEMFEHPYLNGAYSIIPTDTDMETGEGWNQGYPPDEPLTDLSSRENTLMQTEALNPFVFADEREFTGNLIDIAVITKPLSTGQFGYSSLYVFTTEGLWAFGINKDGSLAGNDAISQDVALPGTVCQLDQAVVFTTKKGVMLLTGSDLRCISDKMHGRHYKLDDSIYTLLAGVGSQYKEDWGDLADMAHENLAFMDYMQDARTAYDYVGRRLLFFSVTDNPLPYIYTYMIETDTWHKVVMPAGYVFKSVLNSYPDTFIAMDRVVSTTVEQVTTIHRYAAVVCFSNARSQSDTTRYKGLIVTRPMDLDEDDVRKVMNRLFIRGSYPKKFQKSALMEDRPVKMVVLGSADGQTWQILRSFRGGSYKLFRLVLLCQLTQAERISYVEAEYESRYTNRLR